jgi:hypothetical protein
MPIWCLSKDNPDHSSRKPEYNDRVKVFKWNLQQTPGSKLKIRKYLHKESGMAKYLQNHKYGTILISKGIPGGFADVNYQVPE